MTIMIKQLKDILFKPVSLLLFLLPLVAAALFGIFLEKQQQELVIPIAIVDQDQTPSSKKIVKQMEAQPRIVVHEVLADQANTLLLQNKIDSIFVIKEQFQQRLMDEKREAVIELWTSPSSVASGIVREVMASEVTKMTSAIKAANRVVKIYQYKHKQDEPVRQVWNEAYDYTNNQWKPKPLMTIDYTEGESKESGAHYEEENPAFAPYLGIWSFFIMLSCLVTSDWVVKERSTVFSRMKTTYKGLSTYLLQMGAAYSVFHALQAACSFWVLSSFHFIEKSTLLLMGMILYACFSLAVSMWTASRIRHIGSYYVTGFLMVFIIGICGGSFFSISELSPSFHMLSLWFPQQLLWQTADSAHAVYSEIEKTALFMTLGNVLLWGWTIWRLKRI
ncbi:ABC-2 type transport system permease protein [Bacillus fengqiuensis]|nr:ABC-2 type transport system permease protein [Bacillus fengqiuensis]